MACGKLLVALLLQSHHSHTILQPLLESWGYVSEYAFVSHIIISSQCRVSLSICGLCSLCALDTLIDCRDARRFLAAAKDPLASIRPVLVGQWFLTDVRAEAKACGLMPAPLEDPPALPGTCWRGALQETCVRLGHHAVLLQAPARPQPHRARRSHGRVGSAWSAAAGS